MRVVMPIGCAMHALLVVVFFALDVPALAILNVASTILWAAGLFLARSRYVYVGTTMAMFEVLVHAAACVQVLGWGSGFQYYLLGALVSFFLFPGKRIASAAVVFVVLIEFGVLFLLRDRAPLVPLGAAVLGTMNLANIICAFGLSILAALYYVHVAERAEARSEALLRNVMPAPIAERLKTNEATIADSFDDASVLFADIVGFTVMAQSLAPAEVVKLLDRVFSRFDELVARRGLEKIKTIGDAYMVAAGIPTPRADHAEALALLALEMRAVLAAEETLLVRMGIHSGPVVAGVIGRSRFLYDLWGDTVNTASRMESHGIPGEIQVSEATFELLKDKFVFEERGVVEVKGKGPMRTYLLRG